MIKEYEVNESNKTADKDPKLEIIKEEDVKAYKKYTLPNRLNWLEITLYNIFIKKGNRNDMVKFNELISELYGGIE